MACVWRGRYEELAKGAMMGGHTGMLKILFHADTLKVPYTLLYPL
jgi:hypothetical protein